MKTGQGGPVEAREYRADPSLILIKGVHTVVFFGELSAILWLLVTGLLGRRDRSVAVAAAMVTAESAVFIANRGVCPLTPLAERHGAASGSVSDIFLPDALAHTIPIWATTLLALGVAFHARGAWRSQTAQGTSRPGPTHRYDHRGPLIRHCEAPALDVCRP